MADFGGFLSALGQGFTGYAKDRKLALDQEGDDEAAKQKALALALQMQNTRGEMQSREQQRYAQGFRPGNLGDITNASTLAASLAGPGTPTMPVDPQRFQQVDPTSYIDREATPEAIQQRRATAADVLKQANEAKAHRERVQAMVGTRLPNGQVIDAKLAEAMLANSSLGAAFAKTPPQPKEERVSLVPNGTDANGKPVFAEYSKDSHTITPVESSVAPKGSAQSVQGQAQQARLLAAVSEARLAAPRMAAYEDKLLSGDKSVGPVKQAAGTLMTNLSGAHGIMGALTQAGSEAGLNASDPEYAQYLRDAATIGRAEQMMSPRGGNETMVRANSLLARAGTGAMQNTIDAARMAREALFGKFGGIEQTLTPQQSEKLNSSVQHIQQGSAGRPPLATRVQQLKAQGLSKDAARATLQQEGYDLHGGD